MTADEPVEAGSDADDVETRTVYDVLNANDWNEDKAIDSLLDEIFDVKALLQERTAERDRARDLAAHLEAELAKTEE